MAKAIKKNQLPVEQAERTEQDLLQAMQNFAFASVGVVGINRSIEVLNFLTEKITESPESYQKITNPETVAKLGEVLNKNNGRMPGPMEIMGLIGTFKEIFA